MSVPYYRCRCGNMEAWGSMPPVCEICPDCKSTLAIPGEQSLPGVPHRFVTRWVRTCESSQHLSVCIHCSRSRSNIEQLQSRGESFSVCSSDAVMTGARTGQSAG
jgi:hypothetical protein